MLMTESAQRVLSSAPEMSVDTQERERERESEELLQTGICVGSAHRCRTVRGESHSISSDSHESRMDPILTPGKKLFLLYLLFFILIYQGK